MSSIELTGTISYVHLSAPYSSNPSYTPKYGVVMAFAPTDPVVAQMEALIAQVKAKKWPAGVPANFGHPIKDGGAAFPKDANMSGKVFVNASSIEPVPVAQRSGVPADPSVFYSGCEAKVFINFYGHANNGISAGLNGVQFMADGPRQDGRPTPEQMFKAVEGAPAQVAPAQVAPAQVAPVAGAPVAGVPVAGVPVAGAPVAGVPVAGVPGQPVIPQ